MRFCIHLLRQSEGIFQNTPRGKITQIHCASSCMGFEDTFENAQQNRSQTNATFVTTHLPIHTFLWVIWRKCDGKSRDKTWYKCFSHTCVVNFTYNPRTTCVVFTTYVCSFTYMCGNYHTYVEIPHRQVLGFYHTCVVKHTHRLISPWTNGESGTFCKHRHRRNLTSHHSKKTFITR